MFISIVIALKTEMLNSSCSLWLCLLLLILGTWWQNAASLNRYSWQIWKSRSTYTEW